MNVKTAYNCKHCMNILAFDEFLVAFQLIFYVIYEGQNLRKKPTADTVDLE